MASQRVVAWGDQAVPRAPRQERSGAPHPNHPGQGAPARVVVRERREEGEVVEEVREDQEGEEFLFKGNTHPDLVLDGLNALRKENTFTDVRIQVIWPINHTILVFTLRSTKRSSLYTSASSPPSLPTSRRCSRRGWRRRARTW